MKNIATGTKTVIGGGEGNVASTIGATIGGGSQNIASGTSSTVGGGTGNQATGGKTTVGGGFSNEATSSDATVGGGVNNSASGQAAAIGGGENNVAGGHWSTICGGNGNTTSNYYSAIGGGDGNIASGTGSTIPGGLQNSALGSQAMAAGTGAKANYAGSIVIAASQNVAYDSIRSGGNGQFVIRANGGLYITNIGELAPYNSSRIITTRGGAYLSGNGTTWTNASDANLKENFSEVDAAALLEKIAALPIREWNYKSEADGIRHVGPTAQDFQALFGLGSDDKSISTIDPAGIALAAIQELYTRIKQIEAQQMEIRELRKLIEAMNHRTEVDGLKRTD